MQIRSQEKVVRLCHVDEKRTSTTNMFIPEMLSSEWPVNRLAVAVASASVVVGIISWCKMRNR